jgi:hypothetical protein
MFASVDLEKMKVVLENDEVIEANKEWPPIILVFEAIQDSLDAWCIQVTASGPATNIRETVSLEFYRNKLIPRILKWGVSNNSSSQDSHPNTAPGVPATSLKHVQVRAYFQEYKKMKDAYFGKLQEVRCLRSRLKEVEK